MGKNRNHYSFFLYFVFIIFVLLGCRPVRVQMPDGMYGDGNLLQAVRILH